MTSEILIRHYTPDDAQQLANIYYYTIHHEYQGFRVGSSLMKEVFKIANDLDLKRVFAEVSITAKPFFESKGFKVVKQQIVNIRGVELTNFIMEKVRP